MSVRRGTSLATAVRLHFVATLGVLFTFCSPPVLHAAVFHIDFWTDAQTTNTQDTTILCQNVGILRIITATPFATGTFSVPDAFLGTPDGFLPFRSSSFTISVSIDGLNFDIPGDELRSVRVGDPEEEGLGVRLDGNGCVQRFDIPLFSTSNKGSIIDTDSTSVPQPQLVFWDRNPNGGESYFVETPEGLAMLPAGKAESLDLVNRPRNMFTEILPIGEIVLQGLVHE